MVIQIVHALVLEGKRKQVTHTVKEIWRRFGNATPSSMPAPVVTGQSSQLKGLASNSQLSLAIFAPLLNLVKSLTQQRKHVDAAAICMGVPNQTLLPILVDLLEVDKTAPEPVQKQRLKQAKEILMNPRAGPVCTLVCSLRCDAMGRYFGCHLTP